MRLALAQINTTIGDFSGNTQKVLQAIDLACEQKADVVVFPEMTLLGYPASDLLLSDAFIAGQDSNLRLIQNASQKITVVIGFVERNKKLGAKPLHNSALVYHRKKRLSAHQKVLIPNYDVFDEGRYFASGGKPRLAKVGKLRLGISICEDIWAFDGFAEKNLYARNPTREIARLKPDVILNLSASPYHLGKEALREKLVCGQAKHHKTPIAYVNLVGGNDNLIFDGHSFVANAKGQVIARGAGFAENLLIVDLSAQKKPKKRPKKKVSEEESVFSALCLGLKDYVKKCGFSSVLLGLSGGIDSALVAVLAKEALGPQAVTSVALPSRYSAKESFEDAQLLAKNLGIGFSHLDIDPLFSDFLNTLKPAFKDRPLDVTEENLQARIRGTLLMALSNKFGSLVLTTGNKSELAVGYCTLYGDMNGGLCVIGDLPKTWVYRLCAWINRDREWIPSRVMHKPPSAELRPNQTDQDSLPPYDILDAILEWYVEKNASASVIARKTGFSLDLIQSILRMVDRAEYKRRQAAPTLRVTTKAFGPGRRIPVARKI